MPERDNARNFIKDDFTMAGFGLNENVSTLHRRILGDIDQLEVSKHRANARELDPRMLRVVLESVEQMSDIV